MPGMPIFQDSPSQLKGQIYVIDKDNNGAIVPLSVDTNGSLSAALAAGTEVGLAAGTEVGLATGTTVGLAAGTEVTLAAGADIDTVSTVTAVTTVGAITDDVKVINGTTPLTTSLAAGTEVGLATGTTVGLEAGTEVTLAAGTDIDTVTTVGTVTNDVKIINGTTPLTTSLEAGTEVGLATGTNVIGKVQNDLVFTNVDTFGEPTPLTSKTIGAGATVNADTQDISTETSYNWFIKNTGTTDATQDITLKVQLSPDGGTNWIDDTGVAISVPHDTSKMITVNNFLKNARFVITGGSADTTVISCFQAQH